MKAKGLLALALKQVHEFPIEPCNVSRFISGEFGLVRSITGLKGLEGTLIVPGQPYRLTEGRIVHLRSGHVRVYANLREVMLEAHQLVVASPGTVLQFSDLSPDCDLSMLGFANSYMEGWQKEELLTSYLHGRLYLRLPLEATDEQRLENIFSLLWDVVHDTPFPKKIVQSLISTLFHQITYFQEKNRSADQHKCTRQEEVFNRFLDLVNKHAVSERNVAFYADHLYLTPRYLSTLIRQASNRTIMEWINEAIIQEAKLMLRHSDNPVYQIANDLNFPNASFFCKFFRRMVGKTPLEYRTEV
ncbi:AraC family transcriptional regulator [Butyricimonas hominis]|uniref:Helix-turn-helix transcriptional regulator n=1 Tax=Butyricimonas hominis TaxID=2763032 RepID=A0ABR7D5W4_9BACT|nr:response regulator transcription factor [Butyricimonas hominis]MBC5623363.1 helix-turn-helix transcriptional regulator [Butyricimonas hominis]